MGPIYTLTRHTEIALLGLVVPFTVQDVKDAYRARAKVHHPDVGGDPVLFVALRRAYEAVLPLACEETNTRRSKHA
jgi:hypothetical protein